MSSKKGKEHGGKEQVQQDGHKSVRQKPKEAAVDVRLPIKIGVK